MSFEMNILEKQPNKHHGRQGSDEIQSVVDSIHSQLPESSGGMLARSCSLSTGCHGGWMRVSNSLCPHYKIAPFLHSTSASSSFSSTSPNGWQSPGLTCPLLCRHWAKIQAHCETSLKVLIWVNRQGRQGYLQEKILLFSFLMSISMGYF